MDTFNRCLVFLGAAFINVAIAAALEVAGPPPSTANLPPEPYAGVSPEFGSMSTVSEPSSSKAKRTISWGGVQFAPYCGT